MITPRIEALGDRSLLVRFGDRIDAAISVLAVAAADAIRSANLAGIVDIAPAYASVCVRYDPSAWAGAGAPYDAIAERIIAVVANLSIGSVADSATIEIPVCYGGDFGPDIETLAAHVRLGVDDVIARHCRNLYRVAMLGFAPGFPYLLGLDRTLEMPRRADPRTRVPAGSVAIGGAQTGIYPHETPGGWHVIGRTPLRLFDASREPPALLEPGIGIRFRAISAEEFKSLRP